MGKIVGLLPLLLLAATVTILSCSDNPYDPDPVNAELGKQFILHISETAEFTDTDLKLTFRHFEFDGRCCQVCYCDWEGIASAEFYVQSGNDRDSLFLYISGAPTEENLAKMTCDKFGYTFSLRELWPLGEYPPPEVTGKVATPPVPPGEAILVVTPVDESDSLSGAVDIMDMQPEQIQLGWFDLENASINDDILAIDLTYSGGCRPHFYWAFMSPPEFANASPREADIYIRHADYDPCRAQVSDRVYFDLTSIKQAYLNEYGDLDPIELNIYNYFEDQPGEKLEVIYTPQAD